MIFDAHFSMWEEAHFFARFWLKNSGTRGCVGAWFVILGGIVSHAPSFSREAAFGVMGMGRRGSGAVQSWVKPAVDPPKVGALLIGLRRNQSSGGRCGS